MVRVEAYRQLVTARAGGACEYCRLLEMVTGVTFHVEHVLPRSQGGETTMSNLALSCPGCNLAKGERTAGEDRGIKSNVCSTRAITSPGYWVGTCTSCWTVPRGPSCRARPRGKPPF